MYQVFIEAGKGKNYASMESIPLTSWQQVIAYIKRNPIGNRNTMVKVTNLMTGQSIKKKKYTFYRF